MNQMEGCECHPEAPIRFAQGRLRAEGSKLRFFAPSGLRMTMVGGIR